MIYIVFFSIGMPRNRMMQLKENQSNGATPSNTSNVQVVWLPHPLNFPLTQHQKQQNCIGKTALHGVHTMYCIRNTVLHGVLAKHCSEKTALHGVNAKHCNGKSTLHGVHPLHWEYCRAWGACKA